MTKIKICGITSLNDALAAVRLGADAVGLVFAPSPRRIEPEAAREIARSLAGKILTVGVFVDPAPEETRAVSWLSGFQLHGDESPEQLAALPRGWKIKSFRIENRLDLSLLATYREVADAFLLDSRVEGIAGGSGRSFPWELALAAREVGKPIILAGGLNPGNVGEAIRLVSPDWVDVSSGVEVSPGRKDHAKMEEFINNVRAIDRSSR